jgi:hypothetical protein
MVAVNVSDKGGSDLAQIRHGEFLSDKGGAVGFGRFLQGIERQMQFSGGVFVYRSRNNIGKYGFLGYSAPGEGVADGLEHSAQSHDTAGNQGDDGGVKIRHGAVYYG